MSIGQIIHNRRREKKMSITELSKKSGVSRNSISLLENNEGNPTIDTLFFVAKGLECELDVRFRGWETFIDDNGVPGDEGR